MSKAGRPAKPDRPAGGGLRQEPLPPAPPAQIPLHFATVGSVDDGKSTLIGRLLHDSKSIFEDQLEHIAGVSKRRGDDYVDLALLTDGLRAERDQGITIDVAYRYFSTPHRDFVIADCPGHVQYTRNMITGISRTDLAIVLVDARHGIAEQTRRHTLIAALFGVPRLVIAVNKMDLVGWSQPRFDAIVADFAALAPGLDLDLDAVAFIPVSALAGDNVVDRSEQLDWYGGPTLLRHLETVHVAESANVGARFPVQYVIRLQRAEHRDYRGYAGTVAAGVLRTGDEVVVLPSGTMTTIAAIDTADGRVDEAARGRAVTVILADDVDVSRGDVIAPRADVPAAARELTATLAWLDATASLVPRGSYRLKHTTRSVRAIVSDLANRLDIERLGERQPAAELAFNEIGVATLRLTEPIFVDDYRHSRTTGSFVLIDESTNQTVAAGMVHLAA
jgi:bifunctional enzyme CysN/CysC